MITLVFDVSTTTFDLNRKVIEIHSTVTGEDETDAINSAESCIAATMLALSKDNTFEATQRFIEESITFEHIVTRSEGF